MFENQEISTGYFYLKIPYFISSSVFFSQISFSEIWPRATKSFFTKRYFLRCTALMKKVSVDLNIFTAWKYFRIDWFSSHLNDPCWIHILVYPLRWFGKARKWTLSSVLLFFSSRKDTSRECEGIQDNTCGRAVYVLDWFESHPVINLDLIGVGDFQSWFIGWLIYNKYN